MNNTITYNEFIPNNFNILINRKADSGHNSWYGGSISSILLYWNEFLLGVFTRREKENEDSFIRNGPHKLVSRFTSCPEVDLKCTYVLNEDNKYSTTKARYYTRRYNIKKGILRGNVD